MLSLIRDLSNARRRICYVAIAEALANDHPAEAERVFQLIDDRSDVPPFQRKNRNRPAALPAHGEDRSGASATAHRRAESTPRASLRLGHPGARSGRPGQAGRALGPGRVDPVDRSSGRSARAAERANRQVMVAINPAASILPIVEMRGAGTPGRGLLEGGRPHAERRQGPRAGFADARIAQSAIFLARYDRQVADVFVTQALASRSRSRESGTSGWSFGPRRVLTRGRRGDVRSAASRRSGSARHGESSDRIKLAMG